MHNCFAYDVIACLGFGSACLTADALVIDFYPDCKVSVCLTVKESKKIQLGEEELSSSLSRSRRSSYVLFRQGGVDVPAQIARFLQVEVTVTPPAPAPLPAGATAAQFVDHYVASHAALPKKDIYHLAQVRWFVKRSGHGEDAVWHTNEIHAESKHSFAPVQRMVRRFVPAWSTIETRDGAEVSVFRVCPLPRKYFY